jgi:hypothetical protein
MRIDLPRLLMPCVGLLTYPGRRQSPITFEIKVVFLLLILELVHTPLKNIINRKDRTSLKCMMFQSEKVRMVVDPYSLSERSYIILPLSRFERQVIHTTSQKDHTHYIVQRPAGFRAVDVLSRAVGQIL